SELRYSDPVRAMSMAVRQSSPSLGSYLKAKNKANKRHHCPCLEIRVNGRKRANAGLPYGGVGVNVHMGPELGGVRRKEFKFVQVGGLDYSKEKRIQKHFTWLFSELEFGDEISIRILESGIPNRPKSVRTYDEKTKKMSSERKIRR